MDSFLLLLSVILLAGVWSAQMGNRIGFPVLIGFVGIGVLMGPGGLGVSPGVSLSLAKDIGYIALILILFEGGLHTTKSRIRHVWAPAISLATVGVLISAAMMTFLAYYLLNLPFYPSALLGVAVSSTDAAAVFSILSGQSLRRRLVDVLEVESGTNDPMTFFLTIVLMEWANHGVGSFWHATSFVIGTFVLQMFVGFAVGMGVGYAASFTNQNMKLDTGGLYPTLSLAFAFLSFALAVLFHGSGFLSVYVASVVMGNRRLEHRHSIIRFHEGLSWTMHILMFVVLGLQLAPGRLVHILAPGVGLAVGALFFARPVAVWVSTLGMDFTWQEKNFLAWAGFRGAVPIVLVLTAMLEPGYTPTAMMDAVFFVVIASTLVQGWTVKPLAQRFNLLEPTPSEGLLELVAIARENAIILPIEITTESNLVRRRMVDIGFPPNTLCYAIVRDNNVIVPRGATRLHASDHLLVLSDRCHIPDLRSLFERELIGDPAYLP